MLDSDPFVSPDQRDASEPLPRNPQWWDARYASGDIPWDTGIVPPEVVQLIQSNKVARGWALDLGCGSGVTSRFLAQNGFQVVGLDLSILALRCAVQRASQAGLPGRFVRASVADLMFLRVVATLAVDIGCFHSLPVEARPAYIQSLAEHIAPRGYYLVYAFLTTPTTVAATPGAGLALSDIAAFAPQFVLRSAAHGEDRGRASAWFLMQRA